MIHAFVADNLLIPTHFPLALLLEGQGTQALFHLALARCLQKPHSYLDMP